MEAVGILEYFRFSTTCERILIVLAIISAMGLGSLKVVMLFLYGNSIDTLFTTVTSKSGTTLPSMMLKNVQILCICASCSIVLGYLSSSNLVMAASRQCHRIRNHCFESIMRQDIGWFDQQKSGDLNSRLSNDVEKIQSGMGERLGLMMESCATVIGAIALSLKLSWRMSLVVLSLTPVIIVSTSIMTVVTLRFTIREMESYAKAGSVAEEVLGAIRTVVAFGGEKRELDRYASKLTKAKYFAQRKGLYVGILEGIISSVMYFVSALGFWYGGKLSREDPITTTPGIVFVVFVSFSTAISVVANIIPNLKDFNEGRGAAVGVFKLIDTVSNIDHSMSTGKHLDSVRGELTLNGVQFHYPGRPDKLVLDVNRLRIPEGKTVALVGSSGSGKSTIVSLVQRFYDPQAGVVALDGHDLRGLNLEWYRSQIGIVGQEPVLFATSIYENIRYGCRIAKKEAVHQAARQANAYDFIMHLPQGFDTILGDRGAQLSGGQKQRIAIARAMLRDPKILILDEATSALDNESEALVQRALDNAKQGRTTLVIAHRLSTVRNADLIVGMSQGRVIEMGTHDELMTTQGIYYNLVTQQSTTDPDEEEDDDEEIEISLLRKRTMSQSAVYSRASSRLSRRMTRQASVVEPIMTEGDEVVISEEIKEAKAGFQRTLRLNSPERFFIFLGCLGALVNGVLQPANAIILSRLISVLREKNKDIQEKEVSLYACIIVGIAIFSFISLFLQTYMFSLSGEELTMRCRRLMFKAYLRQNISFFDWSMNNLGSLTTNLAVNATLVKGMTGVRMGTFVRSFSALGGAILVAFIFNWKLALIMLAFVPPIVIFGIARVIIARKNANRDKEALEDAGKVAVESIENIRTVSGLQLERVFVQEYRKLLEVPYKYSLKSAHINGLIYGLNVSIEYFTLAANFYYGSVLAANKEVTFFTVMTVGTAMLFGAMVVGEAASLAPDAGKALNATSYFFWLLDRKPEIDSSIVGDDKPMVGDISLQDLRFRYPTRPQVPVLRGLNIDIAAGQRVALVGPSGCGKSTVIQMLERFYDPLDGQVSIDGQPIGDMSVSKLRSVISLVSQEPTLFDTTIAENIRYGDNAREIPMEEVIEAARMANIHEFILSLPSGYETEVGERGGQLSGGQKQRIAIARAMIRDPKILLLDEATSALDTESEKVVQEALEKVMVGRTSISIAHRLSTIRDADRIIVIQGGKVKEDGTHSELMGRYGMYYSLVSQASGH